MQSSDYFTNSSNQSFLNASFSKWSGYFELPSALTYSQLVLQLFVAVFGIFGNVLVCITVSERKSLRSTTHFYLRSLAIADIGVLAINFPLAVFKSHFIWPFGEAFCLYIYPMTDVFFGASIWSIAVIAIERSCCTTKRHLKRSLRFSQSRPESIARRVLLLVWSVSLTASAVPSYFITRFNRQHKLCYPQWPSHSSHPNVYKQAHVLALLLLWYVVPLALIIYSAVRISKHLNRSSAFHRAMESEWLPLSSQAEKRCSVLHEERKRLKQNLKAKKLLTPVVALFCITMLPLHAFHLAALYYREFIYWKYYMVMFNVVILFVISNSALDPLVYCLVSREFRRGFRNVLLGNCKDASGKSFPSQRTQRLTGGHRISEDTGRTNASLEERRNNNSLPDTGELCILMVSPV